MPHHYTAFGLCIASEIACPELLPGTEAPPDLTICWGIVPRELEKPQVRGKNYQIAGGQLLLDIEKVARYLVREGCDITIEPYPNASDGALRVFLLGSAFGALLYQRGSWPLHGSAIATERGAVLFVGASGNGKSTLAGVFHQRGFQVLADDVCAITVNDGGVALLWPAYPRLKLQADAAAALGSGPDELDGCRNTFDKYELRLKRFSLDPVPVRAVYALHAAPQGEIGLELLKGFEIFQELTTNTYRLHFLSGMQLTQQHFQQVQTLARQARVVRVTRPDGAFLLKELADLIEKDLIQ